MSVRWRLFSLRRRGDRGTTTLEFVVVVPGLLLLVGLLAVAGRVALAGTAVEAAAAAAARQASLERSAGQASASGQQAARGNLDGQGLDCASVQVDVDTSGFARPVGTPAQVRATVTCAVRLSDLSLPGVPGTTRLDATAVSPLDTYRVRG
ncbi:pilus assembly protein [Aquipuribacter sp. SD81]|uniref:pilus assembly protein n=1 Tax=Aquipuribacter sp. SD81 TaxID=3127703 RepID=UPI0030198DE6